MILLKKKNDANNYRKKKNKTTKSKSFEYWTKMIGKTSDDKIAQVLAPLKYSSIFGDSSISY